MASNILIPSFRKQWLIVGEGDIKRIKKRIDNGTARSWDRRYLDYAEIKRENLVRDLNTKFKWSKRLFAKREYE